MHALKLYQTETRGPVESPYDPIGLLVPEYYAPLVPFTGK